MTPTTIIIIEKFVLGYKNREQNFDVSWTINIEFVTRFLNI